MDSRAKQLFSNIDAMTEHQVRVLLETAQNRRDFDIVEALEEELERRGVVLD
ncbi:MAG: hypothetical protein O3A85_02915 [Proteobacteria bacterium]|nr:hypothetical protein [Pseudomonadota bacterium]